jgi:hypothetical protein
MPSLAAGTANNCFEWTPFFIILLHKMIKNGVHSKFSFAAAGGILFTQPHTFQTALLEIIIGGVSRRKPPNPLLKVLLQKADAIIE